MSVKEDKPTISQESNIKNVSAGDQSRSVVGVVTRHPLVEQIQEALADTSKEIDRIRREYIELKQKAEGKAELEMKIKELTTAQNLRDLLNRVNPLGGNAIYKDSEFQRKFLTADATSALVMSIDIRKSTELMLKARTAQAFADYITVLCSELMDIIKNNFGVIDKFTGDGVLAVFPEFYSGIDAAYYAIEAAAQCHAAFKRHYDDNRKSFKSILADVGLGIGIDFGSVHPVQIAGTLTVVGEPVVYACRFSGAAPSGVTLLNQPAYEQIADRFDRFCFVKEDQLEIKHEGRMLAYAVTLNRGSYSPALPDWLKNVDDSVERKGERT